MNRNKHKYTELCKEQTLPLHMQPWWLDAVCSPDGWDVALSFDGAGNIDGALPYHLSESKGVLTIRMPSFTDYAGIWMQLPQAPDMKRERRYDVETRIIGALCEQLPAVAFYDQSFFPDFEYWLPFMWRGYRQTTHYTYVLAPIANADWIYEGFRSSLKKDLRKAERSVNWSNPETPEALYKLYEDTFKRQRLAVPNSLHEFLQIDAAAAERGCRRIYLAHDRGNGDLHAGLYVVWDHQTAYFLLSGADPDLRSSGALFLLQWQAIQDFATNGYQIDFCGSILPGVENALRAFGAERKAYFRIYKAGNRLWRLLAWLMNKDY